MVKPKMNISIMFPDLADWAYSNSWGVKQLVYLKGDKNIERRLFGASSTYMPCMCVLPKVVVVNETARKNFATSAEWVGGWLFILGQTVAQF